MPRLGADMEAGTLVRWRKQPGDVVKRGDVLAEVDTDKGVIDVDVFASGVLAEIRVPVGQRVPVGTVLAVIRQPGDTAAPSPVAAIAPKPASAPAPAAPSPPSTPGTRPPMSPSARRLARELGVDPAKVHGTGPGGAITREDVQGAAVAPAVPSSVAPVAPPAVAAQDRAARARLAIAAAMARSKREIPHYYLSATIDVQRAMNWLAEENARRPVADRLLYGVLLLKAVALALRKVPELNATYEDGKAVSKSEIHVGVAISLREGGLVAPAIHDTDKKSLGELMVAFRDLVTRARGGGLRGSELADGTITVTSLGERGVEAVYGIIFPPQVALVGFGKLIERP